MVLSFRVDQIDHAELTVPDRFFAADWYDRVLGLEILPEFRFWADDPRGPLMIGTANAETKLALFEGKPSGSKPSIGFHLLAFRVSGSGFLNFVSQLNQLQLRNADGKTVRPEDVVDHQLAFSIYFCDPWGHELELTTYDFQIVRDSLERNPEFRHDND